MDDLGTVYARANVGGPTTAEGMLEEWRHLPVAEVWSRRLAVTDQDILFFKAKGHQYRLDVPFRTFFPAEADAFAESVAEDFAAHRVKTDPAQIRGLLDEFIVPIPVETAFEMVVQEAKQAVAKKGKKQ